LIGPRENGFHFLKEIEVYETFDDAFEALGGALHECRTAAE
jgi:hypothetical protein